MTAPETPLPEYVFAELTTACNANCPACDFRKTNRERARSFMERRHLEMLVDELAASSLEVYLQSGEPLLHKDVAWLVETSTRRAGPGRIHLTSNGELARRREIPWHLLGSVCFSVDGRDPLSSAVRELRDQEATVSGVVSEILAARNGSKPRVAVSAVIRPSNQHNLHDYCRYWLDLGVDGIELIHLQGTTPEAAALTREAFPHLGAIPRHLRESDWKGIDVAALGRELERVRSLEDPRVSQFPDLRGADLERFYASSTSFVGPPRICRKPWLSLEIAVDGSIRLSGICVPMSLGSLEDGGIRGAWHHPTLQSFRELLRTHGRLPACARCCGYFEGETVA